jgi:hypothetical protein
LGGAAHIASLSGSKAGLTAREKVRFLSGVVPLPAGLQPRKTNR